MSTRGGVSAFGVVHKSEVAPGQYKRAVDTTPADRQGVYDTRLAQRTRQPVLAGPSNRSLAHTYQTHAYAYRPAKDGQVYSGSMTRRMKHEFDPAHHTPSAVHPKIAYGPSTTPEMRARLDRVISPRIAGKLPHVVAIHHDESLHPNIHAAALGAHQTTGGRGHVVLGSQFDESGKKKSSGDFGARPQSRNVLNHELVHAGNKRPPLQPGASKSKAIGEEARADTVSRSGLYLKNGMVPRGGHAGVARAAMQTERLGLTPNAEGMAAAHHYHTVRELIRGARKVKL